MVISLKCLTKMNWQNDFITLHWLSKVGIDAFIDEITGYQETREKDALQKLLNLYVEEIFHPWKRRFPESFYREIYRLKTGSIQETVKDHI